MLNKAFPGHLAAPPFAHALTHKLAHQLTYAIPKLIKTLPEPPFFVQKKLGDKLLEKLLAEEIETGDYDFLQNRWLKLSINDMGLDFYLTYENGKLLVCDQITEPDVSFSGDAREFILLAGRSEDPDTLFFQRRLVIEGDTELGLYIKNAIDCIDSDNWPSWLNTIIAKLAKIAGSIELEAKKNNTSQAAKYLLNSS